MREWERGRAGEGCVTNNSPACPVYCMHERSRDVCRGRASMGHTWSQRARQEVERGQEVAKRANIVIKWHAYVYYSLLVFTYVYLCLLKFTYVYSCLQMFYHHLLVFICLPQFTRACLPMFTHVYSSLPMFTFVYLCLPLFTCVYMCLIVLTYVYHV